MTVDVVSKIATSQAVWAVLCIFITALVIRELRKDRQETVDEMKNDRKDLINLYEESRAESKEREQQLMDNQRSLADSQERMVSTMGTMNNTLGMLERRMDRMEKLQYQSSMLHMPRHHRPRNLDEEEEGAG